MISKDEHERSAKMLNFLCFYLKEQEKIDESQIVVALLYCVAIQSHNAKVSEAAVIRTFSSILSEVKAKLAIMHLGNKDIPEA
tara:strand:+ start:15377 stop:15625 length:249 start_codon:yes stop_codon:yes gene_type:complete